MDSCGFPVTVKRSEVVAAVLPLQEHWLPMSNIDLLLPPLDFGIFFCYKKSSYTESLSPENMVAALKKSLAQALVSFYPFAGEIMENRHGEPEILCNNRGVDFTHACADVELKDVDLYRPDVSVDRKLVPVKMRGVLSVQVTELKCGGIVVGCAIDHRAADAHSANMFLKAWAEMAQSKTIARLPSFRRSILNPRRPPQPHKSLDKFYAPRLPPPPPSSGEDEDRLTSRIYHIKSEEIDRLQSLATYNGTKRSKIESFSAFLWKSIAEGGGDRSKTVKFGIVVDGRARLGGRTPASLECYFGNVVSIPYAEATVGDLLATPLKGVADMVHECVAAASSAEHFLALIDWVEMRRPKPAVVKVYCKEENDEAAVVVSSGQRFPVQDLDFGWGKPEFGSYHFPWGGQTGYVMPMPSAKRNGDWIVYMHLMTKYLDLVEARAPHVFVPFKF
ncbi:coniferyl alcohol acyltransferase-like [Andrographis paniculata]|uniref:coniferyl alcohol acyltransferase-like n=1 Tax=Andrographis paniculata TaxID=175694 RepID=UPI0021E81401|nr:coniferyl alcohol acyltransferase-like [Andrographis paniculata]